MTEIISVYTRPGVTKYPSTSIVFVFEGGAKASLTIPTYCHEGVLIDELNKLIIRLETKLSKEKFT